MSTQTMQPTQTLLKEVRADKKITLTKIMVLTDFSEASKLALQYAVALARRYNARIYLTHILPLQNYALPEPRLAERTYEEMRQAAERGLGDIFASGELRGVSHETLLYEGALWPTVERLIREHDIDLVVTGTQGRSQIQKMVLGSVAEEVFRQAGCAVLTVGPKTFHQGPREVELKNILLATDFGPGAARGTPYAFSLAQEHGARLTVLHVIEDVHAYTEEEEQARRKANIQCMKKLMPTDSENWCKVEFRVTFGAAVEEILNEAHETNADLIVMGAKARKSFAGHAPLTIAYNIVSKAKCPVLTVRG